MAHPSLLPDTRPALANVLIPQALGHAYTYAAPPGVKLAPGDYVTVPLGPREVNGIVWDGTPDGTVPAAKLKSILTRHDLPPMPDIHRRFIDWTAHYTMAPLGMVLKMAMPVSLEQAKPVIGYTFALSPSGRGLGEGNQESSINIFSNPRQDPKYLTDSARNLRQNHTEAEKKLWFHLNRGQLDGLKFRRQHPVHPYITDFACLEKKLIIELDGGQHAEQATQDEQRTKDLEVKGFRVIRFWNNEVLENIEGVLAKVRENAFSLPSPRPSPQRGEGVRQKILNLLSDNIPRRPSEITEATGASLAIIKGLAATGYLKTVELPAAAPCTHPALDARITLSPTQEGVAEHLRGLVAEKKFHAALLDGVTGAGKTEVYFEAVAAALAQGKQALILLPEIALSNAFLDRFVARFRCKPALWHSQLTPAQRKSTWRGVAEGCTRVVVGARSALYLPYADLGVIIVDEEHDAAYKQEDGVLYHARDMAVVRASLGKIPVVLVSATPSLETMSNVWTGRYQHLHLPDRHGGARLPDIHVIDLTKDKPERQKFLAPTLRTAVTKNLERGEQTLLFLNRRGYAPLTLCRACGHRMNCPRCTAWLVEHRNSGRLQCHHCGFNIPKPPSCPDCGEKDSFRACGPGVERILEEVKENWPDARTAVLASDLFENNADLKTMLDGIRDHQYDIIVGTQIIAKGHHFPKLTLVGVVDSDLGLKGGDLRAAERTFQLLTQVAGRAGREDAPGHVFLQTFMPKSKVIQALAHNERNDFLEAEAGERESAKMPPFARLAGIIVSGKNEEQVRDVAAALGQSAPQNDKLQTLGPAEAPIYRLRGRYRRRLLLRADRDVNVQKTIEHWLAGVEHPNTVRVVADIDPQSFL